MSLALVKCKQSSAPLCGAAAFSEVKTTEGLWDFLNVAAVRCTTK